MNRLQLLVAYLPALAVVASGVGCREQPVRTEPVAASAASATPSPVKSFELIVETFRRGIEEIPIGFVLRDSSGHSRMSGKNEVRYELIPPQEEGEPYKGTITVVSKSEYSIQRSPSDDDDAESEEQAGDQNANAFAPLDGESGVEILDSDLISTARAGGSERQAAPRATKNSQATVDRQKNEQERTYELLYQSGKWVLTTKLNPETEQSIQNAFDRALRTQI